MEQKFFNEYLEKRYIPEMEWYDTKAIRNKKYYLRFQWSAIIISPLVPIFVAFFPEEIKWVTATIAAILAIITAALKTFKFQENWLNYRTIAESLKKEEHFYKADLNEYGDSSDKEALFVERVEALISKENSVWIITHEQKNEKGTKNPKKETD